MVQLRWARPQRLLELLMLLPALLASIRGYHYTLQLGPGSWQATDWYVRFGFGLVRRGVFGDLLHAVASHFQPFSINGFAYVLTLVAIWGVSLFLVSRTRQASPLTRLVLAWSPVFYPTFYLWDPQAGGRKDVLSLLFLVAFLLADSLSSRLQAFARQLLVCVVLPIFVLSHEAVFFFCMPFVLFWQLFVASGLDWFGRFGWLQCRALLKSLLPCVPAGLALALAFFYARPSVAQVEDICRSWMSIEPSLSCARLPAALEALAGLEASAVNGSTYFQRIVHAYAQGEIVNQWIGMFVFGLIFLLFGVVPATRRARPKRVFSLGQCALSLLVLAGVVFAFNLPLYLLALDYGRWASVSLTLLLLFAVGDARALSSCSALCSGSMGAAWFVPGRDWIVRAMQVVLLAVAWRYSLHHCCLEFWLEDPLPNRVSVLVPQLFQ